MPPPELGWRVWPQGELSCWGRAAQVCEWRSNSEETPRQPCQEHALDLENHTESYCRWLVCSFAGAALTKYRKLGGWNNRNVLYQGSRGWKSKIKVSAGLVPSKGYEKGSVPGLSPSFWWVLAIFGSLVYKGITQSLPSSLHGILCACLCLNFLLVRTPVVWDWGPR